jgi:hypothetical protein
MAQELHCAGDLLIGVNVGEGDAGSRPMWLC